MSKQRFLTFVFAVLSGVGLLLMTAGPAEAWGRWGGYHGYWGYGGPYYGSYYGWGWGGGPYYGWGWGYPYAYSYYSPSYYPSYYYPSSYWSSSPAYGSTYSAPVQAAYYSPISNDRADVTVRLPSPDARVWIEGREMSQGGTVRLFESPSLAPGDYSYTIRARWQQDGRMQDQTQTVRVRPGHGTTVNFGS
jgi:uncharacterized protein (TIGR03000 family)